MTHVLLRPPNWEVSAAICKNYPCLFHAERFLRISAPSRMGGRISFLVNMTGYGIMESN